MKAQIIEHMREVINCQSCDSFTYKKILRDSGENVPRPGFVGANYDRKRVLMVGQNPGVPTRASDIVNDRIYTQALRDFSSTGSESDYEYLRKILLNFVPDWAVSQRHFPMNECELRLEDVAYTNFVRCRTVGNAKPGKKMIQNCSLHFESILDTLKPRVVVFIGKTAYNWGASILEDRNIPCNYINRIRSMNNSERRENRDHVAATVKNALLIPTINI